MTDRFLVSRSAFAQPLTGEKKVWIPDLFWRMPLVSLRQSAARAAAKNFHTVIPVIPVIPGEKVDDLMTPFCDRHDHAVAMRRVTADRFVRLVDADGNPGAAVDTGGRGLHVCPVCDATDPPLPIPDPTEGKQPHDSTR